MLFLPFLKKAPMYHTETANLLNFYKLLLVNLYSSFVMSHALNLFYVDFLMIFDSCLWFYCTGDQAKTLMFVQINSDVSSYSETLSTLKFAERVSGVELGAARSSKESKDVRELMEQVLPFVYQIMLAWLYYILFSFVNEPKCLSVDLISVSFAFILYFEVHVWINCL